MFHLHTPKYHPYQPDRRHAVAGPMTSGVIRQEQPASSPDLLLGYPGLTGVTGGVAGGAGPGAYPGGLIPMQTLPPMLLLTQPMTPSPLSPWTIPTIATTRDDQDTSSNV